MKLKDTGLTAQELKEDKDWRDMTDSEWGKLLSGFDKYIDTVKEQIKEMEEKQKKAAQKAAVKAAPDQRTTAASSAPIWLLWTPSRPPTTPPLSSTWPRPTSPS